MVADVVVPVAVPHAEVHMPFFDADPSTITLVEGPRGAERTVFSSGAFIMGASMGVRDVQIANGNAVVSIGSGAYTLRLLSA